jgi:signal transduction histidine kinase
MALVAGAGLLVAGFALEWVRFGLTDEAAAARLELDVRRRVADKHRQIEALARRVSGVGPLLVAAADDRDAVPVLFAQLVDLAQPAVERGASVTLYAGPRNGYRVIAWSAGPADQLPAGRLDGPSQVFVAQGTSGPRLVYQLPIEADGRRVGVAVAETLLAPAAPRVTGADSFLIESRYGRVTAVPLYAGAGAAAGIALDDTFVIATDDGVTLLEVEYAPEELAAERRRHRRVSTALASVPLVVALLLVTGPIRARSSAASGDAAAEFRRSAIVAGLVIAAGLLAVGLLRLVDASVRWDHVVLGLVGVCLVVLFPVTWWWRPGSRLVLAGHRARFVVEHGAGGILMALAFLGLGRFVALKVDQEALEPWHSALFPLSTDSLVGFSGLLLVQLAIGWGVAASLAALATRWRLTWRKLGPGGLAAVCWVLPTVLVIAAWPPRDPLPTEAFLGAAVGAAIFALWSAGIRRQYRHTSQAVRLMLLFAAMVLPPILLVQIFGFYAERRVRLRIEREYVPAIANHPLDVRERMRRAQAEIDGMGGLRAFVSAPRRVGQVTSRAAFAVWNQTNLSTIRLTSEVELFGEDGRLISRFGLNVPEFEYAEGADAWQGSGCEWRIYDELRRFGGEDRHMSRAERGICTADGRLLGAVVVHVLPDYYSLPFVASANTYYDLLSAPGATADVDPADELSVVVYGWGLNPLFTSGPVAWSITGELRPRLYASREPFWVTRQIDNQEYRVYFANDRAGIYAVGYPVATWFAVSMRAADTSAMMAGLFVLFLLGGAAYGPFARRRYAPLRQLFVEIRTSFYRKLFLFFVLAAVGPVLLLTLSFGAYMSAQLHADVEAEATSVAKVARRVFEQLSAAVQHPDEPPRPPTDDEMVYIRQMIDQDVNLYLGSELMATSQRDLFEAGLLPTRTPAAAYQAIALDRLPSYVDEDRLGTFQYLIAAAPVPTLHGDDGAVLTVPLALRQRDIARDLQALNRGVLVGAIVTILFAAGLGASVAGRISDPVARLSRATRQIAAGRLDVRIVADTADELRRLVDDFNSMAARLQAQRTELARSQQLQAWAEMARQVAHEIKNPLTPIQLAAEHLERVHADRGRPLGAPFDQCLQTVYRQVRNLRQIASEFSNFAGAPTPAFEALEVRALVQEVVSAYRLATHLEMQVGGLEGLPPVRVDRTLVARALTNLVENAVQAMPDGGVLRISGRQVGTSVELTVADTGVGMDEAAAARAFEPYFSTKTGGSGLGLANARRNVELCGGTMSLESEVHRGTTIRMTLPVAAPPADAAA